MTTGQPRVAAQAKVSPGLCQNVLAVPSLTHSTSRGTASGRPGLLLLSSSWTGSECPRCADLCLTSKVGSQPLIIGVMADRTGLPSQCLIFLVSKPKAKSCSLWRWR